MPSIINTNIAALNAQRNLDKTDSALATALRRLSSGVRVNSAKDDAAGMAIGTKFAAQVRGQTVAIRNAGDGISFAQTAEGALDQIKEHLLRMRDLAVQSANGSNTSADRALLETEFDQLQAEISRIQGHTTFNGTTILAASNTVFQVGADGAQTVSIASSDFTASSGVSGTLSASTTITGADATNASAAISSIDTALSTLNTQRSIWGAAQGRFEGIIAVLTGTRENLTAAQSRIMDADFATETSNFTRAQILRQAGSAMLTQANSLPNTVLTLLQG